MNILLHEYGMKEQTNQSLTSLFQLIYQQKILQHQIILEETDIYPCLLQQTNIKRHIFFILYQQF